MEGKPTLSRELCKKIFLRSLDDTEVFYEGLLRLTHEHNFLDLYKLSGLELQDQLWIKHGVSQEELNYWMEFYTLRED